MKPLRNWLFLALLLTSANLHAQKVRVAVAANAQFVVKKLQVAFEQETGIKLEPVINSSGKLTTQIQQGAPFEIFLSADVKYPEALYTGGFAGEKPKVYAYGTLVLWTAQREINLTSIQSLTGSSIRKVAVASPKTAPYGEAAVEALRQTKLYAQVEPKLVYGESIAQVNQYIQSGAVEVGFTAKSVVLEPSLKNKGRWVELPTRSYQPIAQGVVLLKNAPAQARRFYNFLFTPKAKAILRQYGYLVK